MGINSHCRDILYLTFSLNSITSHLIFLKNILSNASDLATHIQQQKKCVASYGKLIELLYLLQQVNQIVE